MTKNNHSDDILKINRSILDEDYKACIRIVKNYKEIHSIMFTLGNLKLIEPKDISQILSIDALGVGIRNIEDIKAEIKEIDQIEGPHISR